MQSHRLTYGDRCQIHALLRRGFSKAQIAKDLGFHRSSIGREIGNKSCAFGYYPKLVQDKTMFIRKLDKRRPRKMTPPTVRFIEKATATAKKHP